MNQIKPLRKMVKLRRMQHDRLERAVGEQRVLLAQREAEADEADAEQARLAAIEAEAQARQDALTSRSFTSDDLMSMQLHVQGCAQTTANAGAACVKARAVVAKQGEAVQQAVALVDRNTQRMDTVKERLAKALRERDERDEETESEEAEETAAARMVARQRAERAANHVN